MRYPIFKQRYRLVVEIEKSHAEALDHIAIEHNKTRSDIVRVLVRDGIEEYEEEMGITLITKKRHEG